MALPLFLSVLLIAACGLIYELVASALASYLLGDSVTQFSTVIGTYLFAMGVGSWLSRFISRGLVARFVTIELLVGLVGGFSSTIQRSISSQAAAGPRCPHLSRRSSAAAASSSRCALWSCDPACAC